MESNRSHILKMKNAILIILGLIQMNIYQLYLVRQWVCKDTGSDLL